MKVKDNEQFISLQEASELCSRSPEFLRLRAHEQKLRVVEVNNTWFTTKSWIKEYVAKEYISLQEAAKISPYSQEYLSLRARQGKLKSVKIGRNWLTTIEWLQSYVERVEEYKEHVASNHKTPEVEHAEQATKIISVRALPAPPGNLPVEEHAQALVIHSADREDAKIHFREIIKFAAAFAAVIVLFGYASLLNSDPIQTVVTDMYGEVEKTTHAAVAHISVINVATRQEFTGDAKRAGGEYVAWLWNNISEGGREIRAKVYALHYGIAESVRVFGEKIANRFTKNSSQEEMLSQDNGVHQQTLVQDDDIQVPVSPAKGLVVIPSSENDESVKQQVMQAFSDEVQVSRHDDESGIITPVFRERTGADYLYILVPLHEE